MGNSRNVEAPKSVGSKLKSAARGVFAGMVVVSPLVAGPGIAEPTKSLHQAGEGIHRAYKAVVNPPDTGAKLASGVNEVGLGVMEGAVQVADTWPPWSKQDDSGQKVEITPLGGELVNSEYGLVTPEQRDLIDIAIGSEVDNLDSAMSEAGWSNVRKYEPLIKKIGGDHGLDSDFEGMVIQESHGDPHAESEAGAAGLAQLMPDFAEKFGLKVVRDNDPRIEGMTKEEIKTFRIANDDRYDPEKNLDAAAKSIADNIVKFRDKKIAYLVHHDGDDRVWGGLRKFIFDKYGYRLSDVIRVDIGSDDANYWEAIRRLKENQDTIEGKNPFLKGAVARRVGVIDLISTGEFKSNSGDLYNYKIDAAKLLRQKKLA